MTPHPRCPSLGPDAGTRRAVYRALFNDVLDQADANAVRDHTRQNKALGNDRFRSRIEALIGRSMAIRPRGRPRLEKMYLTAFSAAKLTRSSTPDPEG